MGNRERNEDRLLSKKQQLNCPRSQKKQWGPEDKTVLYLMAKRK